MDEITPVKKHTKEMYEFEYGTLKEIIQKEIEEYHTKPIEVKITKVYDTGPIMNPVYATEGSSGVDLYSSADVVIHAHETEMVLTNIKMEIPAGYEIQIRSRSGLAAKNGLFVLNSPGTIDSDYRGEIKVIMHNTTEIDQKLSKGTRIAQAVLCEVRKARFVEADSLSETARGEGGFGHTGR